MSLFHRHAFLMTDTHLFCSFTSYNVQHVDHDRAHMVGSSNTIPPTLAYILPAQWPPATSLASPPLPPWPISSQLSGPRLPASPPLPSHPGLYPPSSVAVATSLRLPSPPTLAYRLPASVSPPGLYPPSSVAPGYQPPPPLPSPPLPPWPISSQLCGPGYQSPLPLPPSQLQYLWLSWYPQPHPLTAACRYNIVCSPSSSANMVPPQPWAPPTHRCLQVQYCLLPILLG